MKRTFIPVLLGDTPDADLPRELRDYTRVRIKEFNLQDAGYETIYRRITNQPKIVKPPVTGPITKLNPYDPTPTLHILPAVEEKASRPVETRSIDRKVETPSSPALKIWQEKLAYLEEQEAITSDPMQRFAIKKEIEEAKAKIGAIAD